MLEFRGFTSGYDTRWRGICVILDCFYSLFFFSTFLHGVDWIIVCFAVNRARSARSWGLSMVLVMALFIIFHVALLTISVASELLSGEMVRMSNGEGDK